MELNPFTNDTPEDCMTTAASNDNPFEQEDTENPFSATDHEDSSQEAIQSDVGFGNDAAVIEVTASAPPPPLPSAPTEPDGFFQNGRCELAARSTEQIEKLFLPIGLKSQSQLIDLFLKYTDEATTGDFASLVEMYYNSRMDYTKFWKEVNESKTNALDNVKSFWIFSTKTLTSAQTCKDNRVVKFNKDYEYADFSSSTFELFRKNWKHVNDALTDKVFTAYFESFVLWTRVEKFLNKFLVKYISTNKTNVETCSPKFQPRPLHTSEEFVECQTTMHSVLSSLFSCLRRKQPDQNFTNVLFEWIDKCCAVLLRSATLFDHLMILNQSLRLPAHLTDERVFQLIHFPFLDSKTTSGCPNLSNEEIIVYLDHLLTAVNIILGEQIFGTGLVGRERLLKDVECVPDVGMNADSDGKSNWVLIEDSGEEAEEPHLNWHLFREENIVGMLQRIPFHSLLNSVSNFIRSNFENFLPCVAYFNNLISCFSLCFQNFSLNRYSTLRKRVANYCVKMTNFVINTYLEVILPSHDDPEQADGIKIEVDALLLRSFALMNIFYRDEPVASLIPQFHFIFLFSTTAWKIVYLILAPYDVQAKTVEELLQYTEDPTALFKDGLNDFSELDRKLDQVSFESGAAILSTLANVIKDASFKDEQLMVFVLNALFYVTYVSPHHKDSYFKHGHGLVCYLLTSHVALVTFYLNKINRNWEKMSSNDGNKLMLEMNLDHWVPTNSDIELLLHWLESYDISHSLNILSRKILSFVDWQAKDVSGHRMIPFEKQLRVISTVLLVYNNVVTSEAYDVPNNVKLCAFASPKPSNTTTAQSPEQLFASWAWKMIIIMHATGDILNFKSEELKSAAKSAKNAEINNAFCLHTFTALASCDSVSHTFSLSNGGLQMLRELSSQGFPKPSIYILFWNLEFELNSFNSLFKKKEDFVHILVNICQGDGTSITQKIGLQSSSVGANTYMLSSMLVSFLQTCLASHGTQSATRAVEFIVASIFLHQNFSSSFHLLYILEKICYFAFNSHTLREFLIGYFLKLLKELQNSDIGGKSFKVFSSIKYFSPLPTCRTYPEFGFLSYFSLVAQILFEDEHKMWEKLVERMFKDFSTAGAAGVLKDLYSSEKWPVCLNDTSLSIYMLGDLILYLQHDHPALPLICQLFFFRFFFRADPEKSAYGNTSLGDRFYTNYYYKGTFAKFKTRFEEMISSSVSDKNENASTDRDGLYLSASSSYDIETGLSNAPTVAKYCRAFILWIEETKLHTASIVISKLPEKFMPKALTTVIENGIEPLEDLCLQIEMTSEVMKSMKTWHEEVFSCFNKTVVVLEHFDFSAQAAAFRNERIKEKFDFRDITMPAVKRSDVPCSTVDKSLLISNRSLMEYFARCYGKVQDYAQLQVNCARDLCLDFEKYCELTPQQFENKLTSVQCVMKCESLFHRSSCTGPVVFDLSYSCKTENLTVTFELERIWKKMLEAVEKEPKCEVEQVYVVQVMYEVVEALVKLSKSEVNYTDAQIARSNGVDLFFLIANLTSESILCFAPLKETLSKLLHLLASEIVALSGENQSPLLDLMLTKPYLIEMIHSFFSPDAASPSSGTFCAFYQKVSAKIISSGTFDERLPNFLLPKFDVIRWLVKSKPSPTVKCSLLQCMFDIFSYVGPTPSQVHATMFLTVKQQLFQLLQTDFASEFPAVFLSFISLTAAQKANSELWLEFSEMCKLKTLELGCATGNSSILVTQSEVERKQLDALIAFQSSDFVSNITQSLHQIRANNLKTPLLVLLNPHTHFFAKFLFFLSKLVIHSTYATSKDKSFGDPKQEELKCKKAWSAITQLYSPFIAPLVGAEGKGQSPKPPGSSPDEENLNNFFDMLCDSFSASIAEAITYEMSMTHQSSSNETDSYEFKSSLYINDFLNYLNNVLLIENDNQGELVNHYFKSFIKLPWLKFVPNVFSVDIMLQLLEAPVCTAAEVKEFVSQIFLYVDWPSFCKVTASMNKQTASSALHRFLLLSIFLETSSELSDTSVALVVGRLDKLSDLKLRKLSPDHFNVLLSIFFKLNAKKQRAGGGGGICLREPFGVFRLLLEASHLNEACDSSHKDQDLKERQRMFDYKQTFMEHVCKKSLLVDAVESSNQVVPSLLTFVSVSMDMTKDPASAILHLFAPIVKLVNSYSFDQQSNCVEGCRNWTQLPCNYPYLPLLAVSCCQNLANVESLAYFLEIICEAYFTLSDEIDTSECSWQLLANNFDLPYSGKAEFVITCSKKCLYFVLDLQTRVGPRASPEVRLAEIFTWLNEAKNLTAENEMKSFLIFGHCFMALEKLKNGNSESVFIEQCRTFMTYLGELSEDRSSSGICGMIGFGELSKLSQKFRVSCKILIYFLQLQIEDVMSSVESPENGSGDSKKEMQESLSSGGKRFPSSDTLLNNVKVYSVVKDYPDIAATVQSIISSALMSSNSSSTSAENASPSLAMNQWNEIMQQLVFSFYPNSYNFKVLLSYH